MWWMTVMHLYSEFRKRNIFGIDRGFSSHEWGRREHSLFSRKLLTSTQLMENGSNLWFLWYKKYCQPAVFWLFWGTQLVVGDAVPSVHFFSDAFLSNNFLPRTCLICLLCSLFSSLCRRCCCCYCCCRGNCRLWEPDCSVVPALLASAFRIFSFRKGKTAGPVADLDVHFRAYPDSLPPFRIGSIRRATFPWIKVSQRMLQAFAVIFIPRKAKFQRQKQELSESLEESERKKQISSGLPCGPAVLRSWGCGGMIWWTGGWGERWWRYQRFLGISIGP